MVKLKEIREGSKVIVAGGFGREPEQEVLVEDVHSNIKNGFPGIGYVQKNGACRWAYLDQVVRVVKY